MANALTISRFLLIPVFVIFLFLRQFRLAFIVFAFAGITDLLDGMIARRMGEITEIGKVLDPLVDRVLIGAALVSLTVIDRIPLWVLLVVVTRDVVMILGAAFLRVLRMPAMEVTPLGKLSSTLLLLAIALNLLFSEMSHPLLYTSVGFSIVSGFHYLCKGTKTLSRR